MNLLDEVQTPEGLALVVGFPTKNRVEVRLLETTGLRIMDRKDVTEMSEGAGLGIVRDDPMFKVEDQDKTIDVNDFARAAMGRGAIEVEPDVAQAMNRAAVNPDLIDDQLKGKDGRPLKGVALRNRLATLERERDQGVGGKNE